jgi:hypothetical protein
MKNENTERRVNSAFIMAMTAMTGLTLYLASAQMAEIGRTLPPATVAGIVTAIPVMAVSMCGFAAFFAVSMPLAIVAWRERPRRMADDGYRIQQPQYRQLPTVATTDEPVFSAYRGDIAVMAERETAVFTNEFAVPVPDTPAQLGRVTARLGEGDEVTIARAAWLAFAALESPTRDAWREQLRTMGAAAPNEDYSRCKKIASSYKLLDGAGAFISHKLRDMVTSWVCGSGEK